ncbi:MAG: HAD family hydrolase [Candidatus Muiribacterium halophilum]|uniref:D,D-heptose 1,7-bisphosphate phosphatase n=1 Tax=Muiribacterium halophilum TaxID=2053465 RepID=A0A2N5ZK30_MUIH1|nr:MAG: HAD family hydrolase [Candidatus Muirbacterium halophilum]
MNKAIMLDRDGTIIQDKDYLKDPEDIELIKGADKALKRLSDIGFNLIIVTNQSGIARGMFTLEDVYKVNNRLSDILAEKDVFIKKYYICPHHPEFDGQCDCRKPGIKNVKIAEKEFDIDLKSSYFVGDKCSDVLCGRNAGMKGILVRTGKGREQEGKCLSDGVFDSIVEFADFLAGK